MKYVELFEVDFRKNLVDEISSIDLCRCTNQELTVLKGYLSSIKERADALTLEDEIVGYVYNNLNEIMPKLNFEESKRLEKRTIKKVS